MFFKRFSKDKAVDAAPPVSAPPAADAETVSLAPPAAPPSPLAASESHPTVDPAGLGFATTADLEPAFGPIGQERALKAIQFGADMRGPDLNVFVVGSAASATSAAVLTYLRTRAAAAPAPSDWVYVTNFDEPHCPRALKLPAGSAKPFARAMTRCIDELRKAIPTAFESEDYQSRRRALDEEFRGAHEGALETLTQKAAAQNIAILRTPMGFTMAPMHEGRIVKPEVFNQLPDAMRQQVETRVESLQKELETILAAVPAASRARYARIAALNDDVAHLAVVTALDGLRTTFAGEPAVIEHMARVEADMVRNAALFLAMDGGELRALRLPIETSPGSPLRRYLVSIVAAGAEGATGAPICEEANPTVANICGRAFFADGPCIEPGALHRANGGYLLVDARELSSDSLAWPALKRCLTSGHIVIEPGALQMGQTAACVRPEPIPLDVKVLFFGEAKDYDLLSQGDPDFARLFQVKAKFESSIADTPEHRQAYARLMAWIVKTYDLVPVDADGVAGVLDECARLAGENGKLTAEIALVADIVREAGYWAAKALRETITGADVALAIAERRQQSVGGKAGS